MNKTIFFPLGWLQDKINIIMSCWEKQEINCPNVFKYCIIFNSIIDIFLIFTYFFVIVYWSVNKMDIFKKINPDSLLDVLLDNNCNKLSFIINSEYSFDNLAAKPRFQPSWFLQSLCF